MNDLGPGENSYTTTPRSNSISKVLKENGGDQNKTQESTAFGQERKHRIVSTIVNYDQRM